MKRRAACLACLAAALFAFACGGGDSPGTSQNVEVLLTDAPREDVRSVFVTITDVRIHRSASAAGSDAGWNGIAVAAKMPIDLLTLRGGRTARLGGRTLPPGHYQQIRLVLAANSDPGDPANYVVLKDGEIHPLVLPGDTGLKINRQFAVLPGEKAVILVDFDAERSVNLTGQGTYSLKPVLSATVTSEAPASSVSR
jgi:hypothetical protein